MFLRAGVQAIWPASLANLPDEAYEEIGDHLVQVAQNLWLGRLRKGLEVLSNTPRFLTSILIGTIAVFVLGTYCAAAKGTVRIQQADGDVNVYHDAIIVVSNQTLRVTTADGKGTLLIDRAACSYVGKVMRCLPYSMTLDQGGGAHPLDFQRGTVYLNGTDTDQPLPATSKRLPPNGIMLSLTTKIGTIVNVTGTIDTVKK